MKGIAFNIYPMDKEDFNRRIEACIKDNNQPIILCSFTYITPNYSILFTLEELKRFTLNHPYKVIILLWDMNILANPYFSQPSELFGIIKAHVFHIAVSYGCRRRNGPR